MPFVPNELQLRILRALQQLEIDGCPSATPDGQEALPRISLSGCVPSVILRAWVDADDKLLKQALPPLIRRELIRNSRLKVWPLLFSPARLRTPDGRVVVLQWKNATGPETLAEFLGKPSVKRADSDHAPALGDPSGETHKTGFQVVAIIGRQRGTKLLNAKIIPSWSAEDAGECYSITRRGLECLDALPNDPPGNQKITFGFVAAGPRLSAEELQRPLLAALKTLEFEGATLLNENLSIPRIMMRFSAGVPTTFLRAWLDVLPDDLKNAIGLAKRLGRLKEQASDLFGALTPSVLGIANRSQDRRVFVRPDGRQVVVAWEAVKDLGFVVIAQCGMPQPDGTIQGSSFAPTIMANATDILARIAGKGLKWLERQSRRKVAPPSVTGSKKPIRALDAYLKNVAMPALMHLEEDAVRDARVDAQGVNDLWKQVDPHFIAASGAVQSEGAKQAIHRVRNGYLTAVNCLGRGIVREPKVDLEAALTRFRTRFGEATSEIFFARAALRPWFDEPRYGSARTAVPSGKRKRGSPARPRRAKPARSADAEGATTTWLTVTQCAKLLKLDIPGLTLPKAKARVSRAASDSKFTTNGKKRLLRRIEPHSFSTWRLSERDRGLRGDDETGGE